jgi:dihydropteroate synthase
MSANFRIMGVLNVTPDSFSDGGDYLDVECAIEHARRLFADGADLVDVGAESTRPGAVDVAGEIEVARIEPVIKKLTTIIPGERISIDSRKDELFEIGLKYGCRFFNRVGKLPDLHLMRRIATSGGSLAVTHIHGIPATMQERPLRTNEVITEVEQFFEISAEQIKISGFDEKKFWLDPGVGFGKTAAANLQVLGNIREWSRRWPVMIGVSRKGFIGRIFGIENPAARDAPGKVIEWMCGVAGAGLIRTHDVSGLVKLRVNSAREMQTG